MVGAGGPEGHIRTISLVLLRLQSTIDPLDDLTADLQVRRARCGSSCLELHALHQVNARAIITSVCISGDSQQHALICYSAYQAMPSAFVGSTLEP
jgi:hypothetical protein